MFEMPKMVPMPGIEKLADLKAEYDSALTSLELGYSLRSLGEQLVKDCPENDCMIYRNIFVDYQQSIEQYKEVAGELTDTLTRGMRKELRERRGELERMYNENYAIQCYKGK